jgi:hypothetical protein
MYSQKYIFQIALNLKCERKTKKLFENKKKKKLGQTRFQARAGTITNFFWLCGLNLMMMMKLEV